MLNTRNLAVKRPQLPSEIDNANKLNKSKRLDWRIQQIVDDDVMMKITMIKDEDGDDFEILEEPLEDLLFSYTRE